MRLILENPESGDFRIRRIRESGESFSLTLIFFLNLSHITGWHCSVMNIVYFGRRKTVKLAAENFFVPPNSYIREEI